MPIWRAKLKPVRSKSAVPWKDVITNCKLRTSLPTSMEISRKSSKSFHSINLFRWITIPRPGVQLQAVLQFSLSRSSWTTIAVLPAGSTIACGASVSTTTEWPVLNTRSTIASTKTMKTSSSSWVEPNISNVLGANFGWKETTVAQLWPANVVRSFVMTAEEPPALMVLVQISAGPQDLCLSPWLIDRLRLPDSIPQDSLEERDVDIAFYSSSACIHFLVEIHL